MTIAPQLPATAEFTPTPAPHREPDAPKPVPVWSCGPVDSGSLWRLPIALGRPLAVAVDTSAALAVLPGRVIELVTVAEQTLTALRAVVVRTHALLGGAEGITATAEGVLRAADRAANAAAGTVEQAHTTTDRVIALLGAYSDAVNRLALRVRRLAEPTHPSEVDAFGQLLGRLPQLADAMDHQVIPPLGHLEDVVPDMNQPLDQAYQLSHMASLLPRVFLRPNHQSPDRGFAPLSHAVYPRI